MTLLPIAIATGAYLLYRHLQVNGSTSAPTGPQPLQAGIPYLFLVRLPPVVGLPAMEAQHAAVIDFLVKKKAEMIEFAPATVPPFYAKPGVPFGQEIVSFKVVPSGNSTIQRGQPFYDIGTLDVVARLDGKPFATPALVA